MPLSNRIHFFWSYALGRSRVRGLPVDLYVELTNRCNLSCVMCSRKDDVPRGLGNMEFSVFRKIIDEAQGRVEFVFLHGAGEPLLHPEVTQFISYAAEKGIHTGMSTNGLLLESKRAVELINSSLDHLYINLNATDSASYEAVMGSDQYERAVGNSLAFLKLKKGKGKGPRTYLQMIQLSANSSEWLEFHKKWTAAGADGVSFKPFRNFGGNVPNLGEATLSSGRRKPCYLPWRQLFFYHDGTATICCMDFLHQQVLGKIQESSLEELWNHPKLTALRDLHKKGKQNCDSLCGPCQQPRTGLVPALGLATFTSHFSKRLLPTVYRLLPNE